LCLGEAAAQTPSSAVRPEAARLRDEGLRLFGVKDYERAAAKFRAAYAADPQPDFLFAGAQAERLRGNCPAAAEGYRAFLATQPNEEQASLARMHLERCERVIAELAPKTEPKDSVVDAPPPLAERSPWYKDVWGGVLVGTGLAATVVGVILYSSSSSDADAAGRAGTIEEYRSRLDSAETKRTAAIISLAAGGALIIGGALRYVLRDGREPTVSLGPGPSRALLGVSLETKF
jgi:hypothetical protein